MPRPATKCGTEQRTEEQKPSTTRSDRQERKERPRATTEQAHNNTHFGKRDAERQTDKYKHIRTHAIGHAETLTNENKYRNTNRGHLGAWRGLCECS